MNTVDLTNCDREPIHILGAIQPFGFLLAISLDWMVRHASDNAAEILGTPVEIGAPAQRLLGETGSASIRRHIQRLREADTVERIFAVPIGAAKTPMDVALHTSGGSIVIECEPSMPEDEFDAASVVRATIGRLQRHRSVTTMCVEAARQMRALTGFDRVMVYRFDEDGAGEVIAEACRGDLERFLGLRYPASDIPQQARALYLRNWLRIIPDINATPIQVKPYADPEGKPLDLSHSKLRSVSPIHIEYLHNMGVGASMSVSIISQGKLWGLFACHHYSTRRISYARRTAAELYGQMFSLMLESQEREAAAHFELSAREVHNRLMGAIAADSPPFEVLASFLDDFCEVISCDGVGVAVNGRFALRGVAPNETQFTNLIRFLNQASPSQIYSSHELPSRWEPAKEVGVAGVLAAPISRTPRDYLVFFRKEVARTVNWAGDPTKPMQVGPLGDRLTPRKSFELWRETVRGQSQRWTDLDRRVAESLRITMLEVILRLTDAAERERKAAADRQELLIAELNHRVRNILTLIRGLVGHTKAGAGTLDEFSKVLNDRIHALSRAHDQITKEHWGAAPLADLFKTEVAAYLGAKAGRIEMEGPHVLLAPQAFATMALVAHELVTNSAKYGALKDSHGKVKLTWQIDDMGRLLINWAERGGPPVQAPTRRGFVDGVTRDGAMISERSLKGRALLVEDNLIIALDAEEMLLRLGASTVETASSVRDALPIIAREPPDFAMLDVNLVGETSFPIADKLLEMGTHFVFATGYGDDLEMPKEFRGVKVVTKPYEDVDVAASLAR